MALQVMGNQAWDQADPINHGVLQDELVGTSNGVLLRRVTCQAPDTGEIRVFLTTEMTLPPGLIAHLYHRRWRIEKVFDGLKNKLNEKKSWATSPNGQSGAGGVFVSDAQFDSADGTAVGQPGSGDQSTRLHPAQPSGWPSKRRPPQKAGRLWPSTWETLHKPVLYSVKLIRWLRSCIQSGLAWTTALPRLRALYATL